MKNTIVEVNISKIEIDNRHRKEMGDIEGLAQSIEELGLLQPIGITPDNRLIFGERRLRAYRDILGRQTIPARIIEVKSVLLGQIAEDTMRKDYTVSERLAIVDALRSFGHGGDRRSKQARNCELEKLTVHEAAKKVGFSKDGYFRAKKVAENGVPELVDAVDEGRLSVSAAATLTEATPEEQTECLTKRLDEKRWTTCGVQRALKRLRSAKDREVALAKSVEKPSSKDSIRIYHCPFQELEKKARLEPESVNLVCTDIPYGKGFLPQLVALAEVTDRVLVKGGLLVTYCGQHWLPEVLDSLSEKLTYRWEIASYWEGVANVIHRLGIANKWKPILVLSKGGWTKRGRLVDLVRTNTQEKQWHPWQQPLEQVETLVKFFSQPGDVVCDPCIGGGTTAVACHNLGRRFVGCDMDKAAVINSQERLSLAKKTISINKPKSIRPNTIVQGDCRDLIPRLPDGSINFVPTSPPYAEQRCEHYPSIHEADYAQFTVEWMSLLWDKLADDGSVLLVIDPHVKNGVQSDYVLRTQLALRAFGWVQHQTQIWHKRDRGPMGHKHWPRHCYEEILWFSKSSKPFCKPKVGGKLSDRLSINGYRYSDWTNGGKPDKKGIARTSDVWDVPVGGNENGVDHPAKFPVALPEKLIRTFCPKNGTILDPFAGSGSSLLAAKNLSRTYYGFDTVADYCKMARKRLAAVRRPSSARNAG